jgi:hypothetical protein
MADRLQQGKGGLDQYGRGLADAARIDQLPQLDSLRGRIDTLIARLRGAPAGYSGFFDLVQVDEELLDNVYEHDLYRETKYSWPATWALATSTRIVAAMEPPRQQPMGWIGSAGGPAGAEPTRDARDRRSAASGVSIHLSNANHGRCLEVLNTLMPPIARWSTRPAEGWRTSIRAADRAAESGSGLLSGRQTMDVFGRAATRYHGQPSRDYDPRPWENHLWRWFICGSPDPRPEMGHAATHHEAIAAGHGAPAALGNSRASFVAADQYVGRHLGKYHGRGLVVSQD